MQGRDDDGGAAIVEDGGELIAEGFAAAGGHDDADVAGARIERADDFFLAGAKGVIAPVALEGVEVARGGRELGIGGGQWEPGGVGRPAVAFISLLCALESGDMDSWLFGEGR